MQRTSDTLTPLWHSATCSDLGRVAECQRFRDVRARMRMRTGSPRKLNPCYSAQVRALLIIDTLPDTLPLLTLCPGHSVARRFRETRSVTAVLR
jgi:hypothetical protein